MKGDQEKLKKYIFFFSLLVAGIFLGWYGHIIWFKHYNSYITVVYPVRENTDKYKFINRLLACEVPESSGIARYKELESSIQKYINGELVKNNIDNASVYFRELNSGRWIAINEDIKYAPASLLKVPTMIGYFKLASSNPEILQKEVTFKGDFNDNQAEYFKPQKTIQPGQTYTIRELIDYMIKYSDNNATRLLHQNIDNSILEEVYSDLGLSLPSTNAEVDFMTVKSYAYLFRILYSATYLSRSYSELALQILSAPDFPQGIETGVPPNIVVSQKFGERNIIAGESSVKELHDCGIIYYPKNPYLLCIMTHGQDFDTLAGIIKNISGITYNKVNPQEK